MPLTRRDFLKGGLAIASLGAVMPSVMVRTLYAQAPERQGAAGSAQPAGTRPRTLVVLQLGGGNDGLNTVIPLTDGRYQDARPGLALDPGTAGIIPLTDGLGLHPALAALEPVWTRGNLAIIQNVGYPEPNRSHFRSMDIWHTAAPADLIAEGWLGRYLDADAAATGNRWRAVSVGSGVPLALAGEAFVPAVQSVDGYRLQTDRRFPDDTPRRLVAWQALHEAAGARTGSLPLLSRTGLEAFASMETLAAAAVGYSPLAAYPEGNPLAAGLRSVAQIIDAGLGTGIAYVTLSGFDTHATQDAEHAALLAQVAGAVAAFLADLAAHNAAESVALLAFSEFGRRVEENGSGGTDHGTAGPVFLAGGSVQGGLYGEPPDLASLDNGDLRYSTDFRSVYASLLEGWLGAEAAPILAGTFPALPLFRSGPA